MEKYATVELIETKVIECLENYGNLEWLYTPNE